MYSDEEFEKILNEELERIAEELKKHCTYSNWISNKYFLNRSLQDVVEAIIELVFNNYCFDKKETRKLKKFILCNLSVFLPWFGTKFKGRSTIKY